ncbi:hypothetical protein B9Z55_021283 [Caenorhabditis nigoni]|uniref:Uncharacterized protein n=1 Tax=Caenorhabditis nigoni TaxID=1611254 RepID=A0A2G5TRE0_9PELO|nr:hypothetical protein B9Z55_021283 [Caenorhabditis nigoni]
MATTTSEPFDEDAEIAKISASCFTSRDFEQITDNADQRVYARHLGELLIHESLEVIGLTELRRALNFSPLSPGNLLSSINFARDRDIASVSTIQEYYDRVEPRFFLRSPKNDLLHEKNLIASPPFVDSRFPSIRKIFRRRFDEIFQSCGKEINTKTIDQMIGGFFVVYQKVKRAMTPGRDTECWD